MPLLKINAVEMEIRDTTHMETAFTASMNLTTGNPNVVPDSQPAPTMVTEVDQWQGLEEDEKKTTHSV